MWNLFGDKPIQEESTTPKTKERRRNNTGTCPFEHEPPIGIVSSRHFYSRHGLHLVEHLSSSGNVGRPGSAYHCVHCQTSTPDPFQAVEHLLDAHHEQANTSMTSHGFPAVQRYGAPSVPVVEPIEDMNLAMLRVAARLLEENIRLKTQLDEYISKRPRKAETNGMAALLNAVEGIVEGRDTRRE
jgi:hypothetical protein